MEEGSEEGVKFIDAESYQGIGKEKYTFRDIVLSHVKKISTFASVEFRGGYWNSKPHPNPRSNETIEEYVPDTREVYSNAVEYLYDLLFVHFDKEMIKAGEEAEKEEKKVYENNTVVKEKEVEGGSEGVDGKREFLAQRDKISFRSERRKICRKLFRALCCFLKRKDYLKGKEFEEEV